MTSKIADRYVVSDVIGEGSMGVVWRAYDELLQREVALKELRPPAGIDRTEALDRFMTEARTAASLNHPAIVTIHDVVRDGQRVLIAMDLLLGRTLGQIAHTSGPVPAASARAVLTQVAEALAAAHAAGVTHRDVKPDNVFWLESGRVVVCDFGLARGAAGTQTVAGTVMGTPGYMAPEQVKGETAGTPADIFAWGAVGYELLTGRAPFGDPNETETSSLLYKIVHEQPPPLELAEDEPLATLIGHALHKDPDLRPQDGGRLVGMLAGTRPLPKGDPYGGINRAGSHRRRLSKSRAGAMVLTVLTLGMIGTFAKVYSDGGMGQAVRVQPLEMTVRLPEEPASLQEAEGIQGVRFYRVVVDAPCQDLHEEPDASSPAIFCVPTGSLVPGETQAEGAGWVRVSEPVTATSGWLPSSALVPA